MFFDNGGVASFSGTKVSQISCLFTKLWRRLHSLIQKMRCVYTCTCLRYFLVENCKDFTIFFFPKGWWGRRWRWWWWWRRHKYTGNINKKPQGNIPPEYSPLVKANQLLNIVLSPMYVLFIESSTNAAPTADSATFIQSTSMERTL